MLAKAAGTASNLIPDILLHQRLDRRAGRQQHFGERQHQRCRKNKAGAEAKRQNKAAHHMVLDGCRVTPPVRLRDKAGGAHPQEAEPEIDEIENKAAERHAADEVASSNRPIIAVSAAPTSGKVMLASNTGQEIAQIWRQLACCCHDWPWRASRWLSSDTGSQESGAADLGSGYVTTPRMPIENSDKKCFNRRAVGRQPVWRSASLPPRGSCVTVPFKSKRS